ncbi:MAG: response regulator [Chloroflexota bacterium]
MNKDNFVEILMIEDNPDDAELALHALQSQNIVNFITHIPDGVEALEFLFGTGKYQDREITHYPKMILLDLKLPKLSGLEVLEKIRANSHTKAIPVVVLTSSNQDPDIERAYELGVNSYIIKPVDFDQFSETIAKLGMYWAVLNTPHPPKDKTDESE